MNVSILPWVFARTIRQLALEIWLSGETYVMAAQQTLHHQTERHGEYTAVMA